MAIPLTVAELAAALAAIGGFETRPLIGVAVSGGPDSLALAILADRWARARGGKAWALTVDHGLRLESAAETRKVQAWLGARGISHEVMVWAGDKPQTGIQEAARGARYELLAGWCRTRGCLHLLTAHHREDQAETHLIRRRAGSGRDGLAGMSAVRELGGCRLVRPLLGVSRSRLATLLAAEGQPFLSDPSNANPAFERSRLRGERVYDEAGALDAVIAEARACGKLRRERECALDNLLARAVALHPAGFAIIHPAAFAGAPADRIEALLARVAATVGAPTYPPRRARLARLRAALADVPDRARTLGGCRFVPWRRHILVLREHAAAAVPLRIEPGNVVLWDRRFRIASTPSAGPATVDYLAPTDIAAITEAGAGDRLVPRLVRPVLPVWRDQAGLAAVPHLGFRRHGTAVLPSIEFRPATPLTSAGFTVV